MRLGRLLAARGDRARGLIRNPDQAADLESAGIEPVVCDLEGDGDVGAATRGADAVVFAAGAGGGSGAERKWTMDYGGGAELMKGGAGGHGVGSSMGAGGPPRGGDGVSVYLQAQGPGAEGGGAGGPAPTHARAGPLDHH